MEQNDERLRQRFKMGVRNWLAKTIDCKLWGSSSPRSDSTDEYISGGCGKDDENAPDEATRAFLQELQDLASQLKDGKVDKNKKG